MPATRSMDVLASSAVCAAASLRDSLRLTQFFIRVLSGAEGWGRKEKPGRGVAPVGLFSIVLARIAGFADRAMTGVVNRWIAVTVPDWRKLPSPFTSGMMGEVAEAIRGASFISNPLFNTYFYRASIHILGRYREPPFLVLEHRVDAARRALAAAEAADESKAGFLARALIALVSAAPIVRPGTPRGAESQIEPNVLVYATACIALLFAEEGKPVEELDEDQFFSIAGALIAPRMPAIAAAVSAANRAALERELIEIKAMY